LTVLYLSAALGAIIAGFVQGLSGFAFSMIAMSIWAWTIEPQLAAPLAVFGALTGQILGALSVRRGFHWPLLWPFLLGGLVGIPLGLVLLPLLDAQLFRAGLGLLLVVWCPVMLAAPNLSKITRGGRVSDGVIGVIGGAMSSIGGLAGTIPTLWCSLRGLTKDTQRTVIQNFNLAILGATMATYLATGVITREMLPVFGVVAPAMLIPTVLGARLYSGISEAAFRRVVLSLLTLSGVALLAASLPQLIARL
jgi:uncharacterized membrane protein YfcA